MLCLPRLTKTELKTEVIGLADLDKSKDIIIIGPFDVPILCSNNKQYHFLNDQLDDAGCHTVNNNKVYSVE